MAEIERSLHSCRRARNAVVDGQGQRSTLVFSFINTGTPLGRL